MSDAQTKAQPADLTSDALLAAILASLDDDKAEEVVTIDLRGRSDMADYMVICSGRSSRQVASISEKLVDRLKQDHKRASKIEGKDTGDWVLIDTGDVIVHVFRPEVREFYQLEKMWMPTRLPDARRRLMRLAVCAVGRLRAGPERMLADDYIARFNRTGRPLGLGPLTEHEVEDRKGGGMAGRGRAADPRDPAGRPRRGA